MDLQQFDDAIGKQKFPLEFPGHFIGGDWYKEQKISSVRESINPSNGQKLIEVSLERDTVSHAMDVLNSNQNDVAKLSFTQRIEYLKKLRDLISLSQHTAISILATEAGKPKRDGRWEIEHAIRFLDDILAAPDEIEQTYRSLYRSSGLKGNLTFQPIGITAAYLPLFTPFTSFVHYFVASLLAGCPLLVVASMQSVLSGMLIGFWLEKLELQPGVVNVIFGNFSFLRHVLTQSTIAAVFYKGSREHCTTIRNENHNIVGRQLLLQSGGKNSVIICESSSVEKAVDAAYLGMTKNAGQLCTATSRVFVPQKMRHIFVSSLVARISEMKIGPTDCVNEPDMGPLYSSRAVERYLRFQTMANREASETVLWGKVHDQFQNGNFVTPGVHVIEKFDSSKAYQYNVLMAPDVAIYPYDSIYDVIKSVNMTDSSLVAAIVGEQSETENYARLLSVPNTVLNMPTVQIEHHLPVSGKLYCGGYRLSGKFLSFFLSYPHHVISSI